MRARVRIYFQAPERYSSGNHDFADTLALHQCRQACLASPEGRAVDLPLKLLALQLVSNKTYYTMEADRLARAIAGDCTSKSDGINPPPPNTCLQGTGVPATELHDAAAHGTESSGSSAEGTHSASNAGRAGSTRDGARAPPEHAAPGSTSGPQQSQWLSVDVKVDLIVFRGGLWLCLDLVAKTTGKELFAARLHPADMG